MPRFSHSCIVSLVFALCFVSVPNAIAHSHGAVQATPVAIVTYTTNTGGNTVVDGETVLLTVLHRMIPTEAVSRNIAGVSMGLFRVLRRLSAGRLILLTVHLKPFACQSGMMKTSTNKQTFYSLL